MNYDGTGKLSEAIAELYGCSPNSHNDIAKLTKQAKEALGITSKAKLLPDEVKRTIYQWHYDRLNADKAAPTLITSELIDNTLMPDIEPITAIMAVQTIADTAESQPEHPTSNWGGIRPGAGRKSTGKQTVTVRVPVELLPMIEEAKRTGLIPVTNNQDVELLAKVQQLEKALHDSRLELKALVERNKQVD